MRPLTLLPLKWAVLGAIGVSAAIVSAQESSSGVPGTTASRPPAGGADQQESASARQIPDSLKFANGLLRAKKYDLAAEEYERFLQTRAAALDRDDARFGLGNAQSLSGTLSRRPKGLR